MLKFSSINVLLVLSNQCFKCYDYITIATNGKAKNKEEVPLYLSLVHITNFSARYTYGEGRQQTTKFMVIVSVPAISS